MSAGKHNTVELDVASQRVQPVFTRLYTIKLIDMH